jgi:hypothetical protein
MAISFPISDILSADEQASMKLVLGTSTSPALELALTKLTKSAIREFADLVLGQYSPRSASDINERRLLRMVRYYFADRIPTELEFSNLFRLTAAQANTLLRNMTAKSRSDLIAAYKDTLQTLFDAKTANVGGTHHEITIVSKYLVEWLKQESTRVAPSYGSIFKVRGSNDRYGIPTDTYDAICTSFGLTP